MKNLSKFIILILLYSLLSGVKVSAAGSSMETAQKIGYEEALTESLSSDNPDNWYSFTSTENKNTWTKIKLISKSAVSTDLSLYTQNGVEINNMSASENKENNLWVKLNPSTTYYIKIKDGYIHNTGDYMLNLTEIKDDAADESDNASLLKIGSSFKGNLQYGYDNDWFKIKGTSSTSWFKFKLINQAINNGVSITVYDSNNVELYNNSAYRSGTSVTIEKKLNKNKDYYIKIGQTSRYSSASGKYLLSVTEVKDDAGESLETASLIHLKKTLTKQLNVSDDIDYFKLKATASGNYTIKVKNTNVSSSMHITLFDKDGEKIDTTYIYSQGDSQAIKTKLSKNKTYYVSISGNSSGKYTINVSPDTKK